MTTASYRPVSSPVSPARAEPQTANPPPPGRGLGTLAIAHGVLAFAPVLILGAAIGWPASLDAPAAEQLRLIHDNAAMVTLGYAVYLLYSVAVAPLMIGLAARVWGTLAHPVAATVAALAVLSAMARSIGIGRWLTVMPELATQHAAADAAERAHIERIFNALTSYGGGIGEVLGVGLFMALALAVWAQGAMKSVALPRWVAVGGWVNAALLLGTALPAFGLPFAVPIAISVTALSVWTIAVGIVLVRRG
jgi:hypothetical protein